MSIIKQQVASTLLQPNRLGIYAHPGEGKTKILEGLPNALIIDYEDRAKHINGDVVNLQEYSKENGLPILAAFKHLAEELQKKAEDGFRYDFICHDTMSSFEDIARDLSGILFNKTIIGKGMAKKGNYITDPISELGDGAGYLHLHNAYREALGKFDGLAKKCHIYNCHIKQGSKLKLGAKLQADDIRLTGKLRADLLQNCQAFAIFEKDTEEDGSSKGYLNFINNDTSLVTKASSPHLYNKRILISEMDSEGNFTYHWNNIFPEWIKKT